MSTVELTEVSPTCELSRTLIFIVVNIKIRKVFVRIVHFKDLQRLTSLYMFGLDNFISGIAFINKSVTFQLPAVKCNGFIHGSKIFIREYLNASSKTVIFLVKFFNFFLLKRTFVAFF